jgi:hypothetical protein
LGFLAHSGTEPRHRHTHPMEMTGMADCPAFFAGPFHRQRSAAAKKRAAQRTRQTTPVASPCIVAPSADEHAMAPPRRRSRPFRGARLLRHAHSRTGRQRSAVADKIADRVDTGLPPQLAARSHAWQASLRDLIEPRAGDALAAAAMALSAASWRTPGPSWRKPGVILPAPGWTGGWARYTTCSPVWRPARSASCWGSHAHQAWQAPESPALPRTRTVASWRAGRPKTFPLLRSRCWKSGPSRCRCRDDPVARPVTLTGRSGVT